MSNWFSIDGKIALVTGGSRGIGEMIAAGFLQHGAKVYISSRKAEVCDATAEKLQREFGGTCVSLPADLSKVNGVSELVAALKKRESKLDILINNAGTSWGSEFSEFPEFGWDKVMDTNVKGVFFLTQQCLPLLKSAGTTEDPARVVNIGSVDGIRTPKFENYSYAASKAAVHHLTRQLAARLVREHVNVNAIAPGPFPTWMLSTGVGFGGQVEGADWAKVGERNPSGRVGTLEDICGTTIYLCSRAGAFTVGTTITCDGGSIACS